ncbi:hypothetical protein [Sinorhizobium meliloti]|uniref:hypothetical protein n=1 Tax=Rhizobium meliloti TaxID=382 RepID=UPI0019142F7F|nr:hypothetical protein [Sinorhizobium meliloti]
MPVRSEQDEANDLLETLVFTLGVIVDSDVSSRSRISEAHADAQALAASIPMDGRSARPRIVACLERFNAHREAGRVEAAGWMLAAIQGRIAEKNLPRWEELQIVADKAVQLLVGERNLH